MKERLAIRFLRVTGLLAVATWGWYNAAMLRTSQWGYDDLSSQLLTSLGTFSILSLPLAFLPLIGLSWSRKFIIIGALTLLIVASVELFGRTQEYLLKRRAAQNPAGSLEPRWWPFKHHAVGFSDGKGYGWD